MMMGMGGPMRSPPPIPGPKNVNTSEAFVQAKKEQYKTCMAAISESVKDAFNERAWGCLMGAFVADSCGSYLEFYGGTDDHELIMASEEVLDKCMTMPGGGYHEVAPGQVTDDTELMQCLLWGYVDSNPADVQPRRLDLN